MQLTQKETELLNDLKGQESLCVDKYTKHSQTAIDPQLKNIFNQISQTESKHLESIKQIEQGTVPSTNSAGSSGKLSFTAAYGLGESTEKKSDCYLCSDVLATEKHASHLYDTCIFEFNDSNIRSVLNHIQKEEQEHGKMIYDYMKTNGMYS